MDKRPDCELTAMTMIVKGDLYIQTDRSFGRVPGLKELKERLKDFNDDPPEKAIARKPKKIPLRTLVRAGFLPENLLSNTSSLSDNARFRTIL